MECLHSARCSLLFTALVLGCTTPEPTGGDADGSSSATPTTAATGDPTLGMTSTPTTGDGTTDATDGTSTTATGSSGDTTATTATTDTGPTPQCTGVRAFQCAEPIDCPPDACGGPFSPFDADGCMRPPCIMPEDCDPGFACLRAQDYGGCESSGMLCYDDPRTGQCQCVSTPDCGGGHCLPEDEVPPLDCFGPPDEPSCLDAGCSHFETVTEISDTCACTPGVAACLSFLGAPAGDDAPDYFWHEATGTVALFDTSWDWPPVGWRPCTDPGAPPACGCYEPFMAPQCP